MNNNQPFLSHLEELRLRILYSLGGIFAATILSFFFNREILEFLTLPIKSRLIFISPHEAFFVSLKVSLLSGILISSPFTAYQVWKFTGVALKKNEKKFILTYTPLTVALFVAGIIFGFTVVLPSGLKFLLNFGFPELIPMITIEKYISFVFLIILIFGITFQLPLVMRMATLSGIIEKTALKSGRRYAVVLIFIISAMLTPPDVFTQIALALPVIILYEIGIIFSSKRGKKLEG